MKLGTNGNSDYNTSLYLYPFLDMNCNTGPGNFSGPTITNWHNASLTPDALLGSYVGMYMKRHLPSTEFYESLYTTTDVANLKPNTTYSYTIEIAMTNRAGSSESILEIVHCNNNSYFDAQCSAFGINSQLPTNGTVLTSLTFPATTTMNTAPVFKKFCGTFTTAASVSASQIIWFRTTFKSPSSNQDQLNYHYFKNFQIYPCANPSTLSFGPDKTLCTGQTLTLDATISDATYRWQDNSTNPTFTVTQAGTYSVEVTTSCGVTTEEITIDYADLPTIDLGPDVGLCAGQTLQLDATQAGATYLWQDGSTNSTFTISQAGTYSVEVTNDCGTVSDEITVNYLDAPNVDLGTNQTLCAGQTLDLDVTTPGATYLWQDGSTNPTFTVDKAGIYSVEVTNSCGTSKDEIQIDYLDAPNVDFGSDKTLCTGQTLKLDATTENATYLWQDGSTNSTFTVTQAGAYAVEVTNACGTSKDEITVAYENLPTVNLGPDLVLCAGQTRALDATFPNATYRWQDGSTNPTFQIIKAGTYSVEVTTVCGTVKDEIKVTYRSAPSINLGNDQTLCAGQTLRLKATTPDATYRWQDNSIDSVFIVTQPGTYSVEITNSCGKSQDEIIFQYINAPTVNLGKDTTLCFGQTLTLDATAQAATYHWQNGSTNPTFTATQSGRYTVEVTNACGTTSDEIIISYAPSLVNLGPDRSICEKESFILDATLLGATAYRWNDNSTKSSLEVTKPGTYSVTVTTRCGVFQDEISVSYPAKPTVNLGPDRVLCAGQTLRLDATKPGLTYRWQNDSSLEPFFIVSQPGTYSVEVSNGCLTNQDEIIIAYESIPLNALGRDTILCYGQNLKLNLSIPDVSYRWQNETTDSTFSIDSEGIYWVDIASKYCTVRDSIVITYQECLDSLFIPNIITPNQDNINDVFFVDGIKPGKWTFEVYNRFGKQVYISQGYNNDWDGENLSVGVYYYSLRDRSSKRSYKGWVQISR